MKKLLALMLILVMTFALMVSCVNNDDEGGGEGSSEGGDEGGSEGGDEGGSEGGDEGSSEGGDEGSGSGVPGGGYFDDDGWTRP